MFIIISILICFIGLSNPVLAKNNQISDYYTIKLPDNKLDLVISPLSISFNCQINSQTKIKESEQMLMLLQTALLPEHKVNLNKWLEEQGLFSFLTQQGVSEHRDLFKILEEQNLSKQKNQPGALSVKQYSKDIWTPINGYISEKGFLIHLKYEELNLIDPYPQKRRTQKRVNI